MDWGPIVTSAAVGALVSSVTTFVGQWRERRARRSELLLKHSIEIAHSALQQAGGVVPEIPAVEVVLTRRYFAALATLFDTGKLPDELEREVKRLEVIALRLVETRDQYESAMQAAEAIWTGKATAVPSIGTANKNEETDKESEEKK